MSIEQTSCLDKFGDGYFFLMGNIARVESTGKIWRSIFFVLDHLKQTHVPTMADKLLGPWNLHSSLALEEVVSFCIFLL